MADAVADTLTFLVPAWNEAANIANFIDAATAAGDRVVAAGLLKSFEVMVVDDGSTDTTGSILERLSEADDRVRWCGHPSNRGLGAALRTGFGSSTGCYILYSDADLPFDLFEVERLVRVMRTHGADIVAGYRLDRTADGPRRTVYSLVYNVVVRQLLRISVRDVNFAAKLLDSRSLGKLELRSEGSFIDAEILASAKRADLKVIQVGLDYFPRVNGASTLSNMATIRCMMKEMLGYLLRNGRRARNPHERAEGATSPGSAG